jgi:hypothetical protein
VAAKPRVIAKKSLIPWTWAVFLGKIAAKGAIAIGQSGETMPVYEFKVIPAPRRGGKLRGVKTTEDRFALTMTHLMNDLGREGWDYVRADTLPVDERSGFTGTKTTYQNMLVFRRIMEADASVAPLAKLASEPAAMPRLGPAEDAPVGAAPPVGSAMAAE